jgi:hypothetical protein
MSQEDQKTFSRRHGYISRPVEITIRQDAPEEFREQLFELIKEMGLGPTAIKTAIGKVLRRPTTDLTNYDAVQRLLHECEWFRIYDIAEAFYKQLLKKGLDIQAEEYERCMNEYFRENGIGWQMNQGIITVRGPEAFEIITKEAANVLESSGRQTASSEIHEALLDLSRRPNPDLTGAIHHSMAALECVARDICGDPKKTLGEILKKHSGKLTLPKPLDVVVDKAWGYASEMGRHILEGRNPSYEEAELIVGLSATIAVYLSKKNP